MDAFTFDVTDKRSVNSLVGRVYGYMFIGLLITAALAFGVGMLFNLWIFGTLNTANVDYSDVSTNLSAAGATALLATLIISGLGVIVMSFVVNIVFIRGKHSVLAPALIYCILMGLLLSSLVIFVPWEILGITFLITAGMFGIMFLISWVSKGSLNFLGVAGMGLFIGALVLSLIGWIFMLTGALGAYTNLYWIISLMTFAAMMLITIWDMWRIKVLAQNGAMNDNLALYCAFMLYVDFIYLFMKILRFVLYFVSRRN